MLIAGAAAIALVAGGALLLGRGQTPMPAAVTEASADGVLRVDRAKAAQMAIRIGVAEPAAEVPVIVVPAIIAPAMNARVAVAAVLPGVVERVFVAEGDSVHAGQVLARVRSRDVLDLGADLARAKARARVADANAARLSQLEQEGIVAGARADEAAALAAEARADLAGRARSLAMVHGDGDAGIYSLKSPITGRVSKVGTEAGAPLDGTTAPFVVDAGGSQEIIGQLPERLVGVVRPGMVVRLGQLRGRVTAVGATIDPQTRSAVLKARFGPDATLISGGTSSVEVLADAPPGAVRVPADAVVRLNGQPVVFVPAKDGFAVRQLVEAGRGADGVVLRSGLVAGERVVVAGASSLKALASMN